MNTTTKNPHAKMEAAPQPYPCNAHIFTPGSDRSVARCDTVMATHLVVGTTTLPVHCTKRHFTT